MIPWRVIVLNIVIVIFTRLLISSSFFSFSVFLTKSTVLKKMKFFVVQMSVQLDDHNGQPVGSLSEGVKN